MQENAIRVRTMALRHRHMGPMGRHGIRVRTMALRHMHMGRHAIRVRTMALRNLHANAEARAQDTLRRWLMVVSPWEGHHLGRSRWGLR